MTAIAIDDPRVVAACLKRNLIIVGQWKGWATPVLVRCSHDNEFTVALRDVVRKDCDPCGPTQGKCYLMELPNKFRSLVASLGGSVVGEWQGAFKNIECVCRRGHNCSPRPNSIFNGQGLCETCKHDNTYDRFYIVYNGTEVKLGISSNAARVQQHARDGFTLANIWTALEDPVKVERAVLQGLKDAGWQPSRGREYFDIAAYPLILELTKGLIAPKT